MAQLMSIKRNVDVCPGQVSVPAIYHVSQGDKGTRIILGLVNNSANYTIPDGTTATIRGHRADGTLFTEITADVETTEVKFNLTEDMSAVPGRAECEAVLVSGSANVIGTANFIIDVEKSPASIGSVFPATDAAETWLIDELTNLDLSSLDNESVVDAVNKKLDGTFETTDAGKVLMVNNDGTVSPAAVDLSGKASESTIAPEFSTSASYTAGQYVYKNGVLYRFTIDHAAGAWIGTDAVVVTVGGEVTDLKTDISDITGNTVVKMTRGKYITTNGETANINSLVSNATYAYAVLDCAEGDVYTITGHGGSAPRLYAFLGAETNGTRPILEKAISSLILSNGYVTAPTGAEKVVFNVNVNYDFLVIVGKNIVNTWAEIGETKTEISKIEKAVVFPNMADPSKFQQGYKTNTGKTNTTNTTYMFTAIMPVSEGDVLHIIPTGRYLCAYDGNGNIVSAAGIASEYTEYTVPTGISAVTVTFYTVHKDEFMVTKYAGQEYIPYGDPVIAKSVLPEDTATPSKLNYYRTSGDLSANQHLIIERKLPIKNLSVLQFNGNIVEEFAGIEIGYTDNITQADSTHFKIDSSKYYRVTSSPTEFEHNLTISGNVSITITQTYTHLMFDVMCNGQKFHTSSGWAPLNAMPYVKVLSDMTDCVLSLTASKNKKNIVVFGDSYVSYGESRWPYYLAEAEYDKNVTIIGYSGENSANGYQNFTDYMPISDAKYVVWAYGMNDQDTSGSINASWKEKIDAVIGYCENHGIIPVLCTIPNVPSRSNVLKNTYVRSFMDKYPIIDFAKAVGSDVTTAWYDGMLSSDNVHPTAAGAMALYNRAIADFPQLCVDN